MARRIGKRMPKLIQVQDIHLKNYVNSIQKAVKDGLLYRTIENSHFHHWSYNIEHELDVIELSKEDHIKIHIYLKYDESTLKWKNENGRVLATKAEHLKHIKKILNGRLNEQKNCRCD
jgi:hypothetical protein